MIGMSIKRISVLNLCHVLKPFVKSTPGLYFKVISPPYQASIPTAATLTIHSAAEQSEGPMVIVTSTKDSRIVFVFLKMTLIFLCCLIVLFLGVFQRTLKTLN